MKMPDTTRFAFHLLILCVVAQSLSRGRSEHRAVDDVDIMIGSAKTDYQLARDRSRGWNEAFGNVAPLVGTPHGMTHWTVETQRSTYKCIPPFYATDRAITGIRVSHWLSGSCTQDYGSVTILPVLIGKNEVHSFRDRLMYWMSQNSCSGSKYTMRCRKPRTCNVNEEGKWCYRTKTLRKVLLITE